MTVWRAQKRHMSSWIARARHIAAIVFGAWITITSAIGIAVGVHASEGWLAILYGCLGMSMGIAGMAAVWMTGAPRGALLGWFLVGIASRAIVEGDLYFLFISVPIAVGHLYPGNVPPFDVGERNYIYRCFQGPRPLSSLYV